MIVSRVSVPGSAAPRWLYHEWSAGHENWYGVRNKWFLKHIRGGKFSFHYFSIFGAVFPATRPAKSTKITKILGFHGFCWPRMDARRSRAPKLVSEHTKDTDRSRGSLDAHTHKDSEWFRRFPGNWWFCQIALFLFKGPPPVPIDGFTRKSNIWADFSKGDNFTTAWS